MAADPLAEAKALYEARAALVRARDMFLAAAHDKAISAADCKLEIGTIEKRLGRYDEARAAYQRAREVFVAHDRAIDAAHCDLRLGNLEYDLGRYDAARAAYQRAREVFVAHDRAIDAAHCDLGLGNVEYDLGRYDAARAAYVRAREVFVAHDRAVDAADCDLSVGNIELFLWRFDAARTAYQRAREVFVAHDRAASAAQCDLSLGNIEWGRGRFDEARAAYVRAADVFAAHGQAASAARCFLGIGNVERSLGRFDEARAAYVGAREVFVAHERAVDAADCDLSVGNIEYDLGRFDEARIAFERAREVFVAHDGAIAAARCDVGMALVRRADGDRLVEALESALGALTTLDGWRYTLARPADRQQWSALFGNVYRLAFELAAASGDEALLAELIETVRAQAVPAGVDTDSQRALDVALVDAAVSGDAAPWADPPLRGPTVGPGAVSGFRGGELDLAAATAGAGAFPLAPSRRVVIDGRSRVHDLTFAPNTSEGAAAADLVDAAVGVHGPDGWWWGMWVTGDRLYWTLLGPDHTPRAGWVPYPAAVAERYAAAIGHALPDEITQIEPEAERDPDAAARTLDRLVARRVRAGPLWSDVDAERALSVDLGALLPAPLADALAANTGPDPLPVTIAPAPELARLPFVLAAVPGCDPVGTPTGPDPVRLVEVALVRYAPSVPFLDALTRQPSDRGRGDPLVVSISDPRGDLPKAAGWPAATTHLFTHPHPQATTDGPEPRVGTADAVAGFLATITPGAAAVLLCRTHHQVGDPADPLATGGLLLADHTTLAPGVFLHPPGPGRPNSPHTVLLCGCDTMGAAIGHEWTTLSVALLWAGAHHIVTTSWPVFDTAAATAIEDQLAAAALTGGDPAATIREVQLAGLAWWRNPPSDRDARAMTRRAPHTWAVFTLTAGPAHRPATAHT